MRVVTARARRRTTTVSLEHSIVYDFLVSPVVALAEGVVADEYEMAAGWQERLQERGGAALLTELRQHYGTLALLETELDALVLAAPDGPRTVPAFLAAVAAQPATMMATMVVAERCTTEREATDDGLVLAAVAGDKAASTQLLDRLSGLPRRRVALWLADPVGTRADLLDVLGRWYQQVFQPEEERLRPVLEADAVLRRHQLAIGGEERLLKEIGGTIHFSFEPTVQRVIVAPSVMVRPAIYLCHSRFQSHHVIICPVADESLQQPEEAAPSPNLVRLFKALGDETRLKILRLIAGQELYATEIAERLGLSKATVSHHMVLLRAAGLVEVLNDRGTERYYALHRPTLAEPSAMLQRYLASTGTPQT